MGQQVGAGECRHTSPVKQRNWSGHLGMAAGHCGSRRVQMGSWELAVASRQTTLGHLGGVAELLSLSI